MDSTLETLREAVSRGKASLDSPYPPEMAGRKGAVELTAELLEAGVGAQTILEQALIPAMREVGARFQKGECFVPEMLVAANAMKKAMEQLKDELAQAAVEPRGTFILGTVKGDQHDIGKNLVAMMLEGAGWRVIDLGVDVPPERFADTLGEHPGAAVGLSALLTTTMPMMEQTVALLRERFPEVVTLVGGAPVNEAFAEQIGASGTADNPQGAVELLERLMPTG